MEAFARFLGPTDPCSTAVGTEPFSTSVFEGLVRIFATTTEICTRGRLHPGSRPRLPCTPRRPPTRPGIGKSPRRRSRNLSPGRSGIGRSLQRHPFSGPVDSAGKLLHTPERIPTSVATVLLSISTDTLSGI